MHRLGLLCTSLDRKCTVSAQVCASNCRSACDARASCANRLTVGYGAASRAARHISVSCGTPPPRVATAERIHDFSGSNFSESEQSLQLGRDRTCSKQGSRDRWMEQQYGSRFKAASSQQAGPDDSLRRVVAQQRARAESKAKMRGSCADAGGMPDCSENSAHERMTVSRL